MLSRRAIGRIVRHYGADILTHEHMEVERRAYQHGNVTTYEHSVRVARLAVWLAALSHHTLTSAGLVVGI